MVEAVVVMGPSGNGKSTLARLLARELGWRFIEGDDHHPPTNIAKMARGEALTDEDRAPFLTAIGKALADGKAVAACSALKRTYREHLQQIAGRPLLFVLPQVRTEELQRRMESREGHFMPPSMLASQLATLEVPEPDEPCLLLDGDASPQDLARQVAAEIIAQGN